MVAVIVALVVVLVLAINFAINAALVNFGVIPLVDAIWGVDLPFWPVLLTTFLVTSVFAAARGTTTVKGNGKK